MAVTLFNALRTNFKFVYNGALSRSLHFSSRDPVKQAVTCGNNNITSLFSGSNPFGQFLKVCNGFNVISVRTAIRNHFPRPCERKRVLRHGWKKRMSTASGRRILMNRILKGRHVLSH